jgi:peptidoglycan/xylan/chitin deacetylase (PgdA/CDA1 family)
MRPNCKTYNILIFITLLQALLLLTVSCYSGPDGKEAAPPAEENGSAGEQNDPPDEEVDYSALGVNELGQIMVLMYHEIGAEEAEWVRTPDNFRRDLETLYAGGYRLIAMNDLIDGHIDIPAGTTPVVLTFDDGTAGQFRYLEQDGKPVIDPDCAVAILEEFYKEHPDFGLAATFYIFYSGPPFAQPDYVEDKLAYLVERGFEIGNHTYAHVFPGLRSLSPDEARKELAYQVKTTREYLPAYQVRSLALPYGSHPDDLSYIVKGSYEGIDYHNEAILLVGSHPSPSPFHVNYNPAGIPRIRASELQEYVVGTGMYDWLEHFQENPENRYVSDGNPDTVVVPAHLAGQIDKQRLEEKELITY